MNSQTLTDVTAYIEESVYHSAIWDEATAGVRSKAINNCIELLVTVLKDKFLVEADIPVNILSHQTVWFMRIDDTFLRAEMGASYIQMSGVMVNIKDKDRSIAPFVMDALDITPDALTGGVTRRKVGSYSGRYIGTPDSRLRREQ